MKHAMGSYLTAATILLCVGSPATIAAQASTLPRDLPRWTLSAAPTLRIGDESNPNTQFLRIGSVMRMPAGEILIANRGTSELRLFSTAGTFLRSLSRAGQGPGEIQALGAIYRSRDTLFASEFAPNASRLHVFTVGEGYRTRMPIRPSNAPGGVSLIARLSSGEFLVQSGEWRAVTPVARLVSRDTAILGILRGGVTGSVQWIDTLPGNTFLGYLSPTLRDGVGYTRFPLGASVVGGASGDRVWIGESESGAITIRDATGGSVGTVQMPVRPRPFVDAALERAKVRALASASNPNMKARSENIYDRAFRPRTAPVFSSFIPVGADQMGVELFEEEETSVPRSLIIFDRSGKPVAGLIIPANVVLHEIGGDYALGVETDGDGVERVVQYRMARPASGHRPSTR